MMKEPWFWRDQSFAAKATALALTPAAALYDIAQLARWQWTKARIPDAPIVCIGNATLGGVGKTPFAIALRELLDAPDRQCQFLTRGYGGSEPGPLKVNADYHQHTHVGDEALLLARHGTVWVSRNRAAGAASAADDGADVIIMDDGFQNPTVAKTCALLLIDAHDPAGNGRIFPAGPLREPLERAKARADLTVVVGRDEIAAQAGARDAGTPFHAWLEAVDAPAPQPVLAFSGIGAPRKFFQSLKRCGFDVVKAVAFPDHHPYSEKDVAALTAL
ncbi:MAG: tetraacyldisaccharide 4'-kinase, partial [Hyphococcus sp.]